MDMRDEFRAYLILIMGMVLCLLLATIAGCATTPGPVIQPTSAKVLPQHNADFDELFAETLDKRVTAALAELAADREELELALVEIEDLRHFVWDEHTKWWGEAFLPMYDKVTALMRELKELRGEE